MTQDIHQHRILIIDFGSQYTQLIARRVREQGVYCELMNCDSTDQQILDFNPHGIILSGGPETLTRTDTPRISEIIFSLGCPLLGICYGMQAMALQLGGQVNLANKSEYGYAQLCVEDSRDLLAHMEDHFSSEGKPLLDVWMSHGDYVTALPAGFQIIASTDNSPYAGIADFKLRFLLFAVSSRSHSHPSRAKNLSAFYLSNMRLYSFLDCRQYY